MTRSPTASSMLPPQHRCPASPATSPLAFIVSTMIPASSWSSATLLVFLPSTRLTVCGVNPTSHLAKILTMVRIGASTPTTANASPSRASASADAASLADLKT